MAFKMRGWSPFTKNGDDKKRGKLWTKEQLEKMNKNIKDYKHVISQLSNPSIDYYQHKDSTYTPDPRMLPVVIQDPTPSKDIHPTPWKKEDEKQPGKSKIIKIERDGEYEIVTATNPASGKGNYKYRRLAGEGAGISDDEQDSFSRAFRTARDAGKKEFTWRGSSYHTKTRSEVK